MPGVLYGRGQDPVSFSVDARDLRHALQARAPCSRSRSTASTEPAVLKASHRSGSWRDPSPRPAARGPQQADPAAVTVELLGGEDAPGVAEGGILEHVTRESRSRRCPPNPRVGHRRRLRDGDRRHAHPDADATIRRDDHRRRGRRGRGHRDPRAEPRRGGADEDELETETEVVGEGEEGDGRRRGRRGVRRRRVRARGRAAARLRGLGAGRLARRRPRQSRRAVCAHPAQRRLRGHRGAAGALGPRQGEGQVLRPVRRGADRCLAGRASRCWRHRRS